MSVIKVVFIGAGGHGQMAHLQHFASLDNCKVVALAEMKPELARRVAQKYAIDSVYGDYKEMLKNEEFDAIATCQMCSIHEQMVPELLKKGKPVFTEKPVAHTIEAAETILKAEQQSGTQVTVGYQKQSDLATVMAKEKILEYRKTGKLGNMRYIRITMPIGDYKAGGDTGRIYTDEELPKELARGLSCPEDQYCSFICYFVHQVNLLRHLLGESYKVTFADKAGIIFGAESESGVTGIIEMKPYKMTLDWDESALIGFDKGYIKLKPAAPLAANRPGTIEIFEDTGDGPPTKTIPTLPWISPMRQQAMNFLDIVAGKREQTCTVTEAIEDLKNAEAYIELFNKMQ